VKKPERQRRDLHALVNSGPGLVSRAGELL
jgi:hypothetical protein